MFKNRRIARKLAVLFWLISGSSVFASDIDTAATAVDYDSILQEAMDKIHDDYVDHFAFREQVTRKGLNVVGDYDPSRVNAPWILLSSDGREPSDKEMQQYAKDKLKQTEDLKKYPERSPLGVKTMVQPDSLELIEDQKERWLFLFTPTGEDQKMMRKMKGQLAINKQGNYLEWMDVRTPKPFKANFVTKMKEFIMHYEFRPAIDGRTVPTDFEFRIHIAVGGIDVADEHLFANYSEYRLIGD